MVYTYKNKTDRELMLPDIGTVQAGVMFKSHRVIENPNIELIENDENHSIPETTEEK